MPKFVDVVKLKFGAPVAGVMECHYRDPIFS